MPPRSFCLASGSHFQSWTNCPQNRCQNKAPLENTHAPPSYRGYNFQFRTPPYLITSLLYLLSPLPVHYKAIIFLCPRNPQFSNFLARRNPFASTAAYRLRFFLPFVLFAFIIKKIYQIRKDSLWRNIFPSYAAVSYAWYFLPVAMNRKKMPQIL